MADTTVTTTTPPAAIPVDGPVLHFLKELPGWVVCFIALIFFTIVFIFTRDDFIPRIIDALLGGFLGSVVNQVRRGPATTITTDNVTAENVESANTQSGDINTEAGPSEVSKGE